MTNSEKQVIQEQLIQSIIDNLDGRRKRFAFLLGAGASVSSGIPQAATLAKRWFEELETCNPAEYNSIKKEAAFKSDNLAALYSKIYQARFSQFPEDGYNRIEEIITANNVKPSLGYTVLANFLIKTDNNVIVTTNFDRLPETALLTIFNEHAKVIYHEQMIPIVATDNKKPTIIKIHNDAFFQPKSNSQDTATLSEDWKKIINRILETYHLIVLGYGGNDTEGLMKYLTGPETVHERIYWCYRSEDKLPSNIPFPCVEIKGFDEFIFLLNQKLPETKKSNIEKIKKAMETATASNIKNLDEQIEKLTKPNTSQETDEITDKFLESFIANTWWDYQLRINKSKTDDKKDTLYQEGVKNFPKSAELAGNYAIFLNIIREDYDQSEEYYKKSLDLAPDDADFHGNYANFLSNIRKDYAQSEKYYKKALELAPDDANHNGNYAIFLKNIHKDYDQAEKYYKKTLSFAPYDANHNSNYANFLSNIRKDYDQAEKYFKKTIVFAPDSANHNRNYAIFLNNIRKDYDQAEEYFKKALYIAPYDVNHNRNYANFLSNIRKDYDQSEGYYKKALVLAPDNATNNGNYAIFLSDTRKDYDKAEEYYKKALALAPDDANNNGNYAKFLHVIRKDYDRAEEYFKKALSLAPDDASNNGNYANFLRIIRKDYDQSEKYYKKALALAPDHASNNGNYAIFLEVVRKDYAHAEEYFKKALALAPDDASFHGNYGIFLNNIRKDYAQAEEYYKKALALAPDSANHNGSYAIFLHNIRKDYAQAEEYFKKALALAPDDANHNGNYAGALLALGDKEKALPYLEKAERLEEREDLKLELLFYRLAHFPNEQQQWRQQIQDLLKKGVRSTDWNFDGNIEQAEREGCQYVAELRALAKAITTEVE